MWMMRSTRHCRPRNKKPGVWGWNGTNSRCFALSCLFGPLVASRMSCSHCKRD